MNQSHRVEIPARLGLVADTHRSSRNPKALPRQLLTGLEGCDLILHAGDINAPWVIDVLCRIAPVLAVHGNNDEPQLMSSLPSEIILEAGDYQLGLTHGDVGRNNAMMNALERMGSDADIIVFGHSHMPVVETTGGKLLVNPGSPTQRRKAPSRSFAIMDIGNEIFVNFVDIEVP